MKHFLRTLGIVLFVASLCYVSFWLGSRMGTQATDGLLSQTEVQQILADMGYDVRVDGVIGPDSRKAWDLAWNQQSADKDNHYYGDEK